MNVTELRTALSHHDADPDVVLTRLKGKIRRRRRRHQRPGSGETRCNRLRSMGKFQQHSIERAPPGPDRRQGYRDSLEESWRFRSRRMFPLKERIVNAPAAGISIITGTSPRTGQVKPDGYLRHEMTLTNIKTLAGPKVRDGAKGWVMVPSHPPTPRPGVIEIGPDGPLWGPDGKFFGLYTPQKVNKGPLGAFLDQVPLVGDNVILILSGCWASFSGVGLTGTPYHGPLTEIPNSGTYTRLAAKGFLAVPLTTFEGFIPK